MRILRSFCTVVVSLFIIFGFFPNSASALSGTFTANETVANGVGIAQVVTFTPASVSTGETFRLTLNGTNYTYTAVSTSTVAIVVATLAATANADSAVSCADTGSTLITCTARVAGVAFTYASTVVDITAPVITVVGTNPLTIAHGSSYTDSGATAADGVDVTDPVVTSGSVNTSTVGTYTITYVSHDAANNYATSTRTVYVTDQTIPVIAAHSNVTAEATSASGAAASFTVTTSDNVDSAGTATCSPSSGSTFSFGTTTVTCNANDAAGNSAATTTFSVFVHDTTAPVITLSGSNPMSVFQDSTFTDPGATTTDAVDGTTALTTSGSVNTATVGTYTLTYVTHDAANNYATSTRTVSVLLTSVTLTTSANGNSTISGTTTSATTASTTSSGVVVTLTISSGTVVTASSTWDGKIILPIATTTYSLTANSGYTASSTSITEMGAGDISLSLSQAAQIVFTGQAGKPVGWWQAGSFHQITSTCDSTTTPSLSSGADCKIDSGSDLMVWTKHLTTFILYVETLIPVSTSSSSSSSSSSSGGGGGGGGGGGAIAIPASTTTTTTPPATATTTSSTTTASPPTTPSSSVGQVLGTQTYFFTKGLAFASESNEVAELQKFLTDRKFYTGPITGYFGRLTKVAVIKFQKAAGIEAVGSVGPLTRAALNKGLSLSDAKKPSASPVLPVESPKKVAVPAKKATASVAKAAPKKTVPAPSTKVSRSTKKTTLPSSNTSTKKVAAAPSTQKATTTEKVLGAVVYKFTKDLKLDSQGQDVIALQLFLMHNKLYTGQVTGHFGSLTEVAVAAFQKAHGLAATGVVDAPTRVLLNKGM